MANANFESDYQLIGSSECIQELKEQIEKAAKSDYVSVLISGEVGVEDNKIAKIIHKLCKRRDKPFVPVNCIGMSKESLESELFGYVTRTVTGISPHGKAGKVASANKGTLLLYGIGEMDIELQPKLLTLLQQGEYHPMGSPKPEKSDVRVIAATHQSLIGKIHEGAFGEDLYKEINVINIYIPPLRERKEDIPELVTHFLYQIHFKYNVGLKELNQMALEQLMNYDYPGNVQELENIIKRAVVMGGGIIKEVDVDKGIAEKMLQRRANANETSGRQRYGRMEDGTNIDFNYFYKIVEQGGYHLLESKLLTAIQGVISGLALKEAGGNKSKAAKRLKVSYKSTLKYLNEVVDDEYIKKFYLDYFSKTHRGATYKQAQKYGIRIIRKEIILKTLDRTQWNRKRAASSLGINYKTLLNYMMRC